MFATDQQRRWWFATHPEYSQSHKGEGAGKNKEEGEEPEKVSPKDVDDYVDNALKYAEGPVADLLKSLKRHFGTEGESLATGQDPSVSADRAEDGWPGLTGYSANVGLVVPRPPTLDELSQLPEELVRKLFRWFDAFYRNNLFIVDPNALERHHQLVKELADYFKKCGLRVDDFIRILRVADHRMKPDGLHTGEGKGGRWNEEWRQFMRQYPAKNTEKQRERIRKKLDEMERKYGVTDKGYLLPPRSKGK
ncbi:MAG: DUF2380 domain-containing protein [Thermodesulfobacteriota bacterium]